MDRLNRFGTELTQLEHVSATYRIAEFAKKLFHFSVYRSCADTGREITLNTISAGHTIGELSLITQQPASANVVALCDSIVFQVSKQDFLNKFHSDPNAVNLRN